MYRERVPFQNSVVCCLLFMNLELFYLHELGQLSIGMGHRCQ